MNIYYVYAYLRDSDNTPYYIGKGKNHRLSNKNHSVSIPKDKNKIIILAEQLTNEEACTLEQEMICRYGRKDLGTGILHNRTNGGEGAPGFKQSDNHIASRTTMASNEKRSKTMSGRRWTVEPLNTS